MLFNSSLWIYVTKIVDLKETYELNIILLENGSESPIPPSFSTRAPFPAKLLRHASASLKSFSIHGQLCTSLDFLGDHMLPSDVEIGDIIIFEYVGAYGFAESMQFFYAMISLEKLS